MKRNHVLVLVILMELYLVFASGKRIGGENV
jgi:hypothetical protein